MNVTRARTLAASVVTFGVCATLYAVLGTAVSHRSPIGIDAAARIVAGEAPALAWIFTQSCLWPTLTVFGIAGAIVAVRVRVWRARIIFATVTTLVTWQVSDALKELFRRPRPEYWIVHHETSFSYSSGHAMFAVLVYWLWAVLIARSDLQGHIRGPLVIVLSAWGAGVIWSRLALGAHYPTDLAGGLLLACAMLAAARIVSLALFPRARIV